MKTTKRFSLTLLCALLSAVTASCSDTAADPADAASQTTAPVTEQETTEASSHMPEARDFNGLSFCIMNFEQHWNHMQIISDGETGDTLNDAIYRRNAAVEEHLNITVSEVLGSTDVLNKSITAGDKAFDAAYVSASQMASFLTGGENHPLFDLKTEVPHLRMDMPWWTQQANEMISIAGYQFFAANDFHLSYFDSVMPLVMNLQMAKDYDLGDPYALIREGKWTMDVLGEMMKTVSADVNGDGKYTLEEDIFGMFGMSEEYVGLAIAGGATILKKNENDLPYLAIGEEHFINVFTKAVDVMNQGNVFADYRTSEYNYVEQLDDGNFAFKAGRVLFVSDVLFHINSLRDMKDDYAILPRVKFDEAQENYYTYCHETSALLCIPSTADADRSGYVIECLAAESHDTVIPAYYETVLCQKLARDEASIQMLDIVFASRVSDLGTLLNPGSIYSELKTLGQKGDTNLASLESKKSKAVEKALSKIMAE